MTNKRNPDGTFAEGNAGGPGRPPRATELAYMHIVMQACTLDDWQAIIKRAVFDAKDGDATARAWLASYLVGKPSETHFAHKPSRVLAEIETGADPVSDEKTALERDRLFNGMFAPSPDRAGQTFTPRPQPKGR
jgi:hypothetical protein